MIVMLTSNSIVAQGWSCSRVKIFVMSIILTMKMMHLAMMKKCTDREALHSKNRNFQQHDNTNK